jgi:hypothetical protein
MPIGQVYECCNEHITRKMKKFAGQSGVQWSIYGHYIIVSDELDFKKFKFIPKKYYLKKLGITEVKRWLNNDFKSEVDYNPEIIRYCFKLKKNKNNKIVLYISGKKYKLNYTIHAIRYFYKKLDKTFFERDYNLYYMDEKNMNNNEKFSIASGEAKVFDVDMVKQFEDKYDEYNEENDYIPSYERKSNSIDLLRILNGPALNFEIFYEHYFLKLTENQKKIVALFLLGIRITDISRFLKTTQTYITLEIGRLGAKIKKIYNKINIKFIGDISEVNDNVKDKDIKNGK